MSVTVVVALIVPDVPVMVRFAVPPALVVAEVSVRTLVDVVGLGANVPVTPFGRGDRASITGLLNPPEGVTVIVSVTVPPAASVTLAAEDARVKLPPPPPPPTVRVIGAMRLIAVVPCPLVPTMLMVFVLSAVPFCTKKLTVAGPPGQFTDDGLKFTCTPDG